MFVSSSDDFPIFVLVKRNNRTEAGAGEDVDVLGEGAFYVAQRTQQRSPFLTSLL